LTADGIIASVLIVSYQGRSHLADCLPSFLNQDFDEPFEVVVIDNASTDQTVEYVRTSFPAVRTIALPQNVGYGAGNNAGAREARGEYLIVTNQDTVAHPSLVRELVNCLRADPGIGACGPNLIQPWQADYGKIGTTSPPRAFVYPRLTPFGYVKYVEARDTVQSVENNFLSGSCFAISRQAISRLGYLFDDRFFMYGEDVDLSLRLKRNKLRILALRSAVIYHKHKLDSSLNLKTLVKTVSIIRNRIIAHKRAMATPEFVARLPLLLLGGPLNAFSFGHSLVPSLINSLLLIGPTALAALEMPFYMAFARRQTIPSQLKREAD
jgi:GT2 family glycosyltransferase